MPPKKAAAAPAPAPPPLAVEPEESSAAAEVDPRKAVIKAAFSIYDRKGNGQAAEADVPFILRYLNIFADDKDILDKILPDLQGDEPSPFVKYEKFEEVALKLLDSYDYEPDPEEVLLSAFRALDKDNNGWVEAELMQALLTEQGNPAFRPKELQEFMRVALDKKSGRVYYEDYVALMAK